jgi:glycosyltransferase involved in cell wall biosynthesis
VKKVAVITRTKNRPLLLPRARASVVGQTFRDFVWVLVNDAGERGYVEENASAARASGVEVQVLHREKAVGMEAATNDGVRSSESDLIVIHDDDDTWEPEFLARMVRHLDETPEEVGTICYSMAVYEQITETGTKETSREPYNTHLKAVHLADVATVNPYAPISFLFRRSLYDAIGGFDESLPVLGDWDFNLKALLKGDIGLVPDLLANYHLRREVGEDIDDYGNSVTTGVNTHSLYDARYRNRMLRRDIEAGRVGLGFLLFHGRHAFRLRRKIAAIDRVFARPRAAWQLIKRSLGRG